MDFFRRLDRMQREVELGRIYERAKEIRQRYYLSTESVEPAGQHGPSLPSRLPDSSLMLGRPALSSGIELAQSGECGCGGIRKFETGLLG